MSSSKQLRLITFSDASALHGRLVEALTSGVGLPPARVLEQPDDLNEVPRLIRIYVPDAVLAPCAGREEFGQLVSAIRTASPGVQIIAYRQLFDSELLLSVIRVGVLDVLAGSFDVTELRACVARVAERAAQFPVDRGGTEHLFCFVPAKAGSGATTLAVNVAAAGARISKESVFLGDFDANSGVIRFLLKLTSRYSVFDAMEVGSEIDTALWNNIVEKRGSLEVAHSGSTGGSTQLTSSAVSQLMQYLRRRYGMVCCDLPETNDSHSMQMLAEAKETFLVVTPDAPALHLAVEKAKIFRKLGVADRVAVIVNRCNSMSSLSPKDIETVLGLPVKYCIPNDYRAVSSATSAGVAVPPSCELGTRYESIARTLLGLETCRTRRVSLVKSVFARLGQRRSEVPLARAPRGLGGSAWVRVKGDAAGRRA